MPAAQREILALIQRKIETDEMWAEAFGKLLSIDAAEQDGAVWDLLQSVNSSLSWEAFYAENATAFDLRSRKAQQEAATGQTMELDPDTLGMEIELYEGLDPLPGSANKEASLPKEAD